MRQSLFLVHVRAVQVGHNVLLLLTAHISPQASGPQC